MQRFKKSKFPKLYVKKSIIATFGNTELFQNDPELKIPTFLIYFSYVLKNKSVSIDRLISVFQKNCFKSYILSLQSKTPKALIGDFSRMLKMLNVSVPMNVLPEMISNLTMLILNNYNQPQFTISATVNLNNDYDKKVTSAIETLDLLDNIQTILKKIIPGHTNSLIILLNDLLLPIAN